MSYALPGQEPSAQPARRRPGTVTAATWLLVLAGVLLALPFFITVPFIGDLQDAYREAFEGTEVEGAEGMQTITDVGSTAFWLLLGVGLVVLAIFNHRGANASRIVTWVLGGVALCCAGAALVINSLLANVSVDVENAPDPEIIQEALREHLPSWYFGANLFLALAPIPVLLAVLILLALPPSNDFFRKQPPAGPPVNPPAGYPQPGA